MSAASTPNPMLVAFDDDTARWRFEVAVGSLTAEAARPLHAMDADALKIGTKNERRSEGGGGGSATSGARRERRFGHGHGFGSPPDQRARFNKFTTPERPRPPI